MDQTLDDLLSYLKGIIFIVDQDHIQYLNAVDIFFFCYGDNLNDVHNYTEPKLFLDKLQTDGFVNNNSENGYQINLNGIEFIKNKKKKKKSQKIKYKNLWEVSKIIAITINAIILLFFAYSTFIKDKNQNTNQNIQQLK